VIYDAVVLTGAGFFALRIWFSSNQSLLSLLQCSIMRHGWSAFIGPVHSSPPVLATGGLFHEQMLGAPLI
jgi:hypothetical protein